MEKLKIAIIGAGISGLSCAFELTKYNIVPVIFEKRSKIGEELGFSAISSRIFTKPFADQISYLKRKHKLELKPLSRLDKMIMISPGKYISTKGNLGYTFIRGSKEKSLENQIAGKVDIPVIYDTLLDTKSIKDMENDFDFIIVSMGENTVAKDLGVWTDTFTSFARVATVLGDFKPGTCTAWFNTNYAKNSFAYLIPNNSKEATLTLIVEGITGHELDYYWKEFVNSKINSYIIIETKDVQHNCGFIQHHKVSNMLFTGNAAGFTDDLIGLGAFNAIESGIMAAKSIVKGCDYDKLVNPIYDDVRKLHELRKLMNTFENEDFDKLLTFISIPGIKQFIYNNPFFKIKYFASLAKHYNEMRYKHRP